MPDVDTFIPGISTTEGGPTPVQINELRKTYRDVYATFHKNCARADDYFYGRNAVPVPEGADAVRVPISRAAINTAADHVDVGNASTTVPLTSQRARSRAERLQKFYDAVWASIPGPVKQTAVKHMFSYGISFFGVFWSAERWPDAPRMQDYEGDDAGFKDALEEWMERRHISNPIDVVNINPQRLIWDDSRLGVHWAMEVYQRRDYQFLNARFPEWKEKLAAKNMTEPLEWTEYWDDTWHIILADGEQIHREKHGFGFMPIVPAFASATLDWNDGPPHERYQGLLEGRYDLIDEVSRVASRSSAIIKEFAHPTLDIHGPQALVEKVRESYEFSGVNAVPNGVEIKVGPRPQVPPDVFQHMSMMQNLFEESTYPNVVRGMRPTGVSNGYGMAVLAGMGRLVFQGVADGMARAMEQCNRRFAMLIERKAKAALTIHGRTHANSFDQTIRPDDIRGYYESRVTLKAEAPEERERESMLAIRLLQSGVISTFEAMRRSGVSNPLEMLVEIQSERLMSAEPIQAVLQQMLAQRVGLVEQAAEAVDNPLGGLDLSPESLFGQPNAGEFLPGLPKESRPGETSIQGQKTRSRSANANGLGGILPQGLGDLDALGGILSQPGGGPQPTPGGGFV